MRSTAIQSSTVNTPSDADSRKLVDFCGAADRNRQSAWFYREPSRWQFAPLVITAMMLLGNRAGKEWKSASHGDALRQF
jgi:hypothetical protein